MPSLLRISNSMAERFGAEVRSTFELIFRFLHFQKELLKSIPMVVRNFHFVLDQMYIIGITSIPLIVTTSFFTGAVLAWQMAFQLSGYAPDMYIGVAVGKSVMVELGPVLVAMVMCGRIGAAMCAELGTMAVTEQMDAMKCLNLSPHRYLLAPRLVAAVAMLPILVIIASLVSIMGGWLVSYVGKGISIEIFMKGVKKFYANWDVIVGLIKAATSGYIIASYATFFGYYTTNGAEGVGKSTKASVVASMTSVLISAYVISALLL